MIVDLPSTDTSAVNRTMVDLRESAGAVALGRVLTLLIITEDGPEAEAAIQAANDASREHPCRVLVLARGIRRAASRLDAQIRIGGDAGASEVIVLRMYGPLADQGGSHRGPAAAARRPDRRVVAGRAADVAGRGPGGQRRRPSHHRRRGSAQSPSKALAKLRQRYHPGDTDLAWSRITSWRALLTAALDQPPHEPVTRAVGGRRGRLGLRGPAHRLAGRRASVARSPASTRDVPGGPGGADRRGPPRARERAGRAASASTRRARCSPSPASPTVAWPCPGAPPASAWPRSCAASTRTTSYAEAIEAMPTARGRSKASSSAKADRMSAPEVVVHPDTDATASDAADRLITALAAAQAARGTASVVLTGGGVGHRDAARGGVVPRRDAVDWVAVEVFWGDERFLPAGDAERNDAQAREALLDALPLDPARVHPMRALGRARGGRRRRPGPRRRRLRQDALVGGGAARWRRDPRLRRAARRLRAGGPRAVGLPRLARGARDGAPGWSPSATAPSRRPPASR